MTALLKNSFKDMDRVRSFVTEEEFKRLEAGIFAGKYIVVPSFVDVHVHFREPGFFYKESILTGSTAAAHAGYSHVMPMPNLNPVPDSREHLKEELDIIERDAVINVIPYGSITVGEKGKELADLEGMAPDVCAFSDDGVGLNDPELMKEAMRRAKALGKLVVAHCEDLELRAGGYIHDGKYARLNGHKGICSESEWKPIERDLKLAEETGAGYHVCHISTKESVQVIREAKARGVNVTCETAPHYLVLDDMCLREDGRYKMNPPIRSEEDRLALIEGLKDGTIDCIVTDHAPHSAEEKAKPLTEAPAGMVGLETSLGLALTYLYHTGELSLNDIIQKMTINPAKILGLRSGTLALGAVADLTIFDLNERWTVDPDQFASKARNTPFAGMELQGRVKYTIVGGKVIYQD